MRLRKPIGITILAVAWVSMMGAQSPLTPPKNLRLLGVPPSPPSGDPHGYFNALVALPSYFRSWSLRNQAQLDDLTNLNVSNYFTYAPGSDSYSNPQDGAKYFEPLSGPTTIPGNQQLKMPLNIGSGSILITWDFWYGPECQTNVKKIAVYKQFQVRSNGNIWWTHVNQWDRAVAPNDISMVYESLNAGAAGTPTPPSITDREPVVPPGVGAVGGRAYPIKRSTWTRYWIDLQLNVPSTDPRWDAWKSINAQTALLTGSWHMLSMWIADENRNPVRIIYRVPWVIRPGGISGFDFEFNTSCNSGCRTGPLIGYGRNVVVLRDYATNLSDTDTSIFKRPVR